MALLNFNAATVAPQTNNFDPIPAGIYNAQVTESDIKRLGTGNGDCLNLTLTILDGPMVTRKVWARLNIRHSNAQAQSIAQAQLSSLCHAVGVINLQDSTQLHMKPLRIKVKVRPAEGNYSASNDVTAFEALAGGALPVGGMFAPPAAPAAPRPPFTPPPAHAPMQAPAAQQPAPWATRA